jgi:hypothetical protein
MREMTKKSPGFGIASPSAVVSVESLGESAVHDPEYGVKYEVRLCAFEQSDRRLQLGARRTSGVRVSVSMWTYILPEVRDERQSVSELEIKMVGLFHSKIF